MHELQLHHNERWLAMSTETLQPLTTNTNPLTAMDRCDRCGAQAYIRAELGSQDMLFCAHHGREHRDALTAKGWVLHDEIHVLTAVEAAAKDFSGE
jgi:ribosomal protein S14